MTVIDLPPAKTRSVTVPLTPEEAFDLFARRTARWWPDGEGPDGLTIDPRTGGRLKDADGTDWGRVTRCEPGARLDLDFGHEDRPDEAACVSIRFVPTEGGTRVEVTYAPAMILADCIGTQWIDPPWAAILAAFRGVLALA